MLTKEKWVMAFEQKYNRKPTPKEFIEAKNKKEFVLPEKESDSQSIKIEEESVFEEIAVNVASKAEGEQLKMDSEPELIRFFDENEGDQQTKVFCFRCGQPNSIISETCSSCRQQIVKQDIPTSFFASLTSKLTEVGQFATKKTRELTQNVQAGSQLHLERKKKDMLIQTLGNAYYEKHKAELEGEFQELIAEIRQVEQLIQGLELSSEHRNLRV